MSDKTREAIKYFKNISQLCDEVVKAEESEKAILTMRRKSHAETAIEALEKLAYHERLEEQGSVFLPPCKIGEEAWIVRNYNGVPIPQKGIISSILFNDDMELTIVVKHIGRGRWGVNVFRTYDEAIAGLERDGDV